jgi:HEAT repeat protein
MTILKKEENWQVRKAAARALAPIEDARVMAGLIVARKKNDLAVVAGAYAFFMGRGTTDSEDLLITALNEYGDRFMRHLSPIAVIEA